MANSRWKEVANLLQDNNPEGKKLQNLFASRVQKYISHVQAVHHHVSHVQQMNAVLHPAKITATHWDATRTATRCDTLQHTAMQCTTECSTSSC